MLLALLTNIVLSTCMLATLFEAVAIPTVVLDVIRYVRLPVCLFMTVAIFLLAKQLSHIAVAVICGVLMWIPLISFLTLFAVNAKATRFLQQYGFKVGLLGASDSAIQTNDFHRPASPPRF